MRFPLPTLFVKRRHPKSGDVIKITSLKNNKHLIGTEGIIVPFKKNYLVIEKGNKRIIITLKDNKIEYVQNGKKYKI